jgi:hypothetical protein
LEVSHGLRAPRPGCRGLDRVEVDERPGVVVITVWSVVGPGGSGGPCPDSGAWGGEEVLLERPIACRELRDGATGRRVVDPDGSDRTHELDWTPVPSCLRHAHPLPTDGVP